jgi:hypothetical protein
VDRLANLLNRLASGVNKTVIGAKSVSGTVKSGQPRFKSDRTDIRPNQSASRCGRDFVQILELILAASVPSAVRLMIMSMLRCSESTASRGLLR